jgi:coiled-coil domain-containing protein 55
MAAAKVRDKERDRMYERKLLKERQAEDGQFVAQPRFVTAAFKQKMLDDEKWEYEDRLAEAVEEKTDVRTRGMEGFYAGLLTKNIALGGDVATHALSAYTTGSARQERVFSGPAAVLASTSVVPDVAPSFAQSSALPTVAASPAVAQRASTRAEEEQAAVSTEEHIDSARSRYLARKRSAAAAQVG